MLSCHLPRVSRFALPLAACLLTVLTFSGPAEARWIDLGGRPLEIALIESDGERTVLEVTLGGFEAEPVTIDGETYYRIALDEASIQQVAGFPALPDVRRSVIIPDDRRMAVTVLEETFVDVPDMPVAPSKGHLPRTVNPETVPYTFDSFYQGTAAYPATRVDAHDPYILRDFRGMVVDVNAFQYAPREQTLRVYTRMLVEVRPVGPGTINVLERAHPLDRMDTQFAKLYANHFVNFGGGRYTPVTEDGDMLIIAYDAFVPNVTPLCEWKLQKGLPTKLVALSEIGTSSADILNYIQNEYDTSDLAYVLLVGDAAQMPTINYGAGSDPSYSLLAGGDNYPDIFVGRLSAENGDQVDTQVARTIHYERDVTGAEIWPQYGTGVASNQGPGHYGEYDDEHEDLIRDDLLGYGYIAVDQIYDPTGTAAMVSNALNEGRGIVNYTGHGSTTSWGSTGFSNTHVNALTNVNMLPFICSVACVNGNFTGTTCFAEAWLRATDGGEPTGAIACYMSTISQSWDPPMYAQDEAVDLLIADEMRTIGGLWFNGSCLMMDATGASGVNEFKCWTIFGDPSLGVRTKQGGPLTVNHPGSLILGQSEYGVSVAGVAGAVCALYSGGVLYGSALTDGAGNATIVCDPAPPEPMTLTLTVTAYNKVTFVDDVEVVPAEGPYLLIREVEYLDSGADGLVHAGEAVQMRIKLRNVGIENATGVSAAVGCADEHIDLTNDTCLYPDIPPDGEAWSLGTYDFNVDPLCPDMHTVIMPTLIECDERGVDLTQETMGTRHTFESQVAFVVHAPMIAVLGVEVDDTVGGNGNLRLDPGETATLTVWLHNSGSGPLDTIVGILSCSHPQIAIHVDTGTLAGLGQDESGALAPVFVVEIGEDFQPYSVDFVLDVTGSNDYQLPFDIRLPVAGFYETVEAGQGDWTHYVGSTGFIDEWHVSTQRNHTPGGTQSWKCGSTGAGDYGNLLDAVLETPPVTIGGDGGLLFWMWIDAEASGAYPDRAYDGGLVEMSIDGGPFEQITPEGGYTHTIREGSIPGPFEPDTPVFSGNFDWQEIYFDLAGITGTVAFRFRFGSDGADTREGWFVDDIEVLGLSSPADVTEDRAETFRLQLAPSQPNPFDGDTHIRFVMPHAGQATLQVFDPSGRLVRTLVSGALPAGPHTIGWEGADNAGRSVSSGLYYYRLRTDAGSLRRSVVVLQ